MKMPMRIYGTPNDQYDGDYQSDDKQGRRSRENKRRSKRNTIAAINDRLNQIRNKTSIGNDNDGK